MDFLQRTPFFRLLLPFIVGIITYQYVELLHWSLYALFLVSIFLILYSLFIKVSSRQFQFRWLFGSGSFLILFVIGYFLTQQKDIQSKFEHPAEKATFFVELINTPVEKNNSFACRVQVLQYSDSVSTSTSNGKAILYFQKDSLSQGLQFGDKLLIGTTFIIPPGVQNPNGFNYAAYLKRQGVGATAYISSDNWKLVDRSSNFSFLRVSEKSRLYLLSVFKQFGITGDEFAVLAALTLGYKDALHPVLRENYSHSGAMHILAVSGLHVGVIFLILSFLLSFLNKNKKLKIIKAILIIVLLWVYAFLTGLSPSVLRATVMFSFVAFGTCFERKSQIYNTIFVSAFLMLLFNPNYLFEVGFQLSYCAVISIVYFQPKIVKWFRPKNKILRWSWELIAVSLSAQIGTAPLALFYFHQFANYFLLTNMIAIPVATLIIYFAVALLILAPVPFISTFFAFILQWLLRCLNFSIQMIDNLPLSISIFSLDIWQLVFIFGAILLFAFYFENKKFIPLFGALCLILSVLVIRVVDQFNVLTSTKMIVYADNKNTHVDFIDGNKHSLFSTDSLSVELVAENFWIHNKLGLPVNLNNDYLFRDGFYEFHKRKIYIMTQDLLIRKTCPIPLELDYLIIGNRLKPKIDQILTCVHPRKIIVDKSVSKWYANNIKQACMARRIGFYSVDEKGAYILNITD